MQTGPPPTVPLSPKVPEPLVTWAIIVAVVVSIATATAAIGIPALQRALAQPKMSLTDVSGANARGSCDAILFPGPPQFFSFSFTIHNTGDADGFARIAFIVGQAYFRDRYFVASHSSADKDATVRIDDCGVYDWDVQVESVERA